MNKAYRIEALAKALAMQSDIISKLIFEVNTRHISKTDAPIFQECLNDTYLIAENLRNIIKTQQTITFPELIDNKIIESLKVDTLDIRNTYIENTLSILDDLMEFQSKWSVSYTIWLSGFKAHKVNRPLLTEGTAYLHTYFQLSFPSSKELNNDILRIQARLKGYSKSLESLSEHIQSLLINHKSFDKMIRNMFSYRIIHILLNLFSFYKVNNR